MKLSRTSVPCSQLHICEASWLVLMQLAKVTAAHAEERGSLKEKAERLQKANKQRRQELGEMQDKLAALQQRASAHDQVQNASPRTSSQRFRPAGGPSCSLACLFEGGHMHPWHRARSV